MLFLSNLMHVNVWVSESDCEVADRDVLHLLGGEWAQLAARVGRPLADHAAVVLALGPPKCSRMCTSCERIHGRVPYLMSL